MNKKRETSSYQYLILWLLSKEPAPVSGGPLSERVQRSAAAIGVDISNASFYMNAKKMASEGLVTIASPEGDKRSKLFSITPAGVEQLEATWDRYAKLTAEFNPSTRTPVTAK